MKKLMTTFVFYAAMTFLPVNASTSEAQNKQTKTSDEIEDVLDYYFKEKGNDDIKKAIEDLIALLGSGLIKFTP